MGGGPRIGTGAGGNETDGTDTGSGTTGGETGGG